MARMETSARPSWWLVIVAAMLTVASGAAAFYIAVFVPSADPQIKSAFMTMTTLGFGGILGLAVPPMVASVRGGNAKAQGPTAEDEAYLAHRQKQLNEATEFTRTHPTA